MDANLLNETKSSSNTLTPTLIWCVLMPLIHFLSLISNILCIIVFCSKTFIHKPIAIYFICLLISDSTTLLIGYSEMLDRETSMMNKSSFLCLFNGRIIHTLTEWIYTWMGKFCLEWMLYKVLWTRASTILLAILSIQRARTFFSINYRESRSCAVVACLMSFSIALLITCFEWIGVQCEKSPDESVYWELFQSIMKKTSAREFYSNYLYQQRLEKYSCLSQTMTNNSNNTQQFNCTTVEISSEFHSLTQTLISNRDVYTAENTIHVLMNSYDQTAAHLTEHITRAKSSDIILRLFEKRSCQITFLYSNCLKFHQFLHSISFGWNRHTLAIFFGNALPSFLVVLANLVSIKAIYCSQNLQYLQEQTGKTRRQRRLQNDLRAFLVILAESFSVITISWGIPIFLTMYHCQTLYVVSMAACPEIQRSLAIFLFTDLFNSSTNCLLYSLSGEVFRRRFISIMKRVFTCNRYGKDRLTYSPSHQLQSHASNEPSTTVHFRHRESSHRQTTRRKISDEEPISNPYGKTSSGLKTFLINQVSAFHSRKKTNRQRRRATNISCSSSSSSSSRRRSDRNSSQGHNQPYSSSAILTLPISENRSFTKQSPFKYMTNL